MVLSGFRVLIGSTLLLSSPAFAAIDLQVAYTVAAGTTVGTVSIPGSLEFVLEGREGHRLQYDQRRPRAARNPIGPIWQLFRTCDFQNALPRQHARLLGDILVACDQFAGTNGRPLQLPRERLQQAQAWSQRLRGD